MPELPEVETVVRTLEKQIANTQIIHAEVMWNKVVIGDPEEFVSCLTGEHFRTFNRRGKYLLFGMDSLLLESHLRMEGKYYVVDPAYSAFPHTLALFDLDDGRELRYVDTRKFGRMELLGLDTDLRALHNLGPEPFWDAFSADYVYRECHHRKIPIKTLLLDQSFVAGIGNIYADEILFACGIRPGRSCCYLNHGDCAALVVQTRRILTEAIAAGGTTIRSYTSSLGVTGMFQLSCMVHEQKVCKVCGSEIRMRRIGGRSSYYCPHCQKR